MPSSPAGARHAAGVRLAAPGCARACICQRPPLAVGTQCMAALGLLLQVCGHRGFKSLLFHSPLQHILWREGILRKARDRNARALTHLHQCGRRRSQTEACASGGVQGRAVSGGLSVWVAGVVGASAPADSMQRILCAKSGCGQTSRRRRRIWRARWTRRACAGRRRAGRSARGRTPAARASSTAAAAPWRGGELRR